RNPLFDAVFAFDNFSEDDFAGSTWNAESYDSGHRVAKFDLSLSASESDNGLYGCFEYSTALFRRETIERFIAYFKNILNAISIDPDVQLSAIDFLPAAERKTLLDTFNDTKRDYPVRQTVLELFAAQVVKHPNRPAIVFGERQLSFKQLDELSNRLAHYIRAQQKIEVENVVAIQIDRSDWYVVAMLAVLKNGAAYVPIDPAYPASRKSYILADSQAKLLVDMDLIAKFEKEKDNFSCIQPELAIHPDNLAYIIYTSGSTGQPKGVMIEHHSLVNICFWYQEYYQVSHESRATLFAGVGFDASVWEVFPHLTAGACLYPIADGELRYDTRKLKDFLAAHAITCSFLPTQVCQNFAEQNFQLPGLKIQTGGDALKLSKDNNLYIYNNYGPTESTVVATIYKVEPGEYGLVSIGKPGGNTVIYILSKEGALQPLGVVGELCIAGEGLARGYINREAASREKFVDNPFVPGTRMYRTGDLARWLPDGNIEFLGRMDKQVKIRGFRIELGEIENTLQNHDSIDEVVVVALEEGGEKFLACYYVADAVLTVSVLKEYLLRTLPEYMIPAHYIQLEQIPLTANGKVDRKSLPYPNHTAVAYEVVAPSNELESRLRDIWSDVLKKEVDQISVTQSFFDLGGHSLKATVLINKMAKELEVEVPLKEIFRTPDIRSLAAYIESSQKTVFNKITRAAAANAYPLSSAQRRMYFLYEFDKESLAYNMPEVNSLDGSVEKADLEVAFRKLIARHEALRTSFHQDNDQLVQKIAEEVSFEVESLKVGAQRLDQLIDAFVRPFDLSQAPLMRVGLVADGAQQWLLVDMHHIISDGVSRSILIRDFLALYEGQTLPSLNLQYKDFAVWQQSDLQQLQKEKQKAYWLAQFSEEVPILELPTDYPRPLVNTFEGDGLAFQLDRSKTDALITMAQAEGATLYMMLLSAFNVLLTKLSNQEDIVIGTPVSGRQHADVEEMVGMFVNTLPLRNQAKGSMTFRDFLSNVKENTLAAFEQQSFQYETLIDALQIVRDTSRNPLFDVLFTFQNFGEPATAGNTEDATAMEQNHKVSKFDLTLSAVETATGLDLSFEYSTALFKKETMTRFMAYFHRIIDAVIVNADVRITDIDILSVAEKQQLLEAFQGKQVEYPAHNTILDFFEKQAAERPEQIALRWDGGQMSYDTLKKKSDKLSVYLREEAGLSRGDFVGVLLDRSASLLPLIYGILKAGCAYIPMDPKYPVDRVRAIAEDSGMKLLVGQTDCPKPLQINGLQWMQIQNLEEILDTCADKSLGIHAGAEDLAYVIYTSGSTGKPKGVMIEHRSLSNLILSMDSDYPLGASDNFLLKTTYTFDVSVAEIFGWFLNGGSLTILPAGAEGDPSVILQTIEKHAVTHINFVPSMFAVFLEDLNHSNTNMLKCLSYIFLAGEALPMELVHQFNRLKTNIRLENIYGPTEATIYSCGYSTANLKGESRVPIGRPLNNLSMYILDRYGSLQVPGVPGELCIGGAALARGYLNNEALTKEKFVDHPFASGERLYRTGDLARWLPDGSVDYLGRIDKQVKIRGYRIELGEIEKQLMQHQAIKESAVIVLTHEGDKYLLGYYVSDVALTVDELMAHLSQSLPDYMLPTQYMRLDQMPLTSSGKLNRRALPRPRIEIGNDFVVAQNDTERQLVAIWSEVLKLDAALISTTRSFFELGGHSLKAIQLASLVRKRLHAEISLVDIFKSPSIRAMAALLKVANLEDPSSGEILTLLHQPEGATEYLFLVHDGSGDVQAYVELAGLWQSHICWGLRSDLLGQLAPKNVDLKQLATQYIEQMKKVQADGPYQLLGWSLGGLIAFEMTRQLEAAGEKVDQLIMLDTEFPSVYPYLQNEDFSLANEKALVVELFESEASTFDQVQNIEELWKAVIDECTDATVCIERIRQRVPNEVRALIPQFSDLPLVELVTAVNAIRSLERAAVNHVVSEPLNAPLIYISASESKLNLDLLPAYFHREVVIREIEGDHFNILRSQRVAQLVETIVAALDEQHKVFLSR
ncbi:MAG: amino acid adenylation domain-containing protein, partial [Bacteroidota bacterium]